MKKTTEIIMRIIPHIIIILSIMLLVFVVIDHFNSAMNFINNIQTKSIMFAVSVLSLVQSIIVIVWVRLYLLSKRGESAKKEDKKSGKK